MMKLEKILKFKDIQLETKAKLYGAEARWAPAWCSMYVEPGLISSSMAASASWHGLGDGGRGDAVMFFP